MAPLSKIRIALATQTPLLRLDDHGTPAAHAVGDTPSLLLLRRLKGRLARRREEGRTRDQVPTDQLSRHDISPGGVSRMVLQSIQSWHASAWVGQAHWFSLQPNGPPHLRLSDAGIDLHHLSLPPDELGAYARTKERLWADIHGLPAPRFGVEDFRFYARYNGLASDAILERVPDIDVAYVHDFQLLQVGAIVGLAAPCVLRWHVPFDPTLIPRYARSFLLRMMEAYDGVIVSSRRDLEGLTNAGYRGRIRQLYPHSDPAAAAAGRPRDVQELNDQLHLHPDDPVVLLVARMDPIKRHDLAITAIKQVAATHPRVRLVLVGNGSFSGSRASGLGLSKSTVWRESLAAQVRALGLEANVSFTGWIPDRLVAAAYERADVLVLPSDIEGFGLTPFEAWAHGKPCIISSGCGAAEVVSHGADGLVFPPGDAPALAAAINQLLGDREAAQRMGETGRIALDAHSPQAAAARESHFLQEAMERFRAGTQP